MDLWKGFSMNLRSLFLMKNKEMDCLSRPVSVQDTLERRRVIPTTCSDFLLYKSLPFLIADICCIGKYMSSI